MNTRHRIPSLIAAGLVLLAFPAILLAADPEPADEESTVIIIGDDGDEVVIDMDEIQEMVNEAMAGMDEVLAELDDMQLQVRLGRDNRLDLSYDDSVFELDLDQIMTQVAAAVRTGFDEIHADEWTHSRNRWTDVSDDDLRQELEELRREMKELRRELRKAQESRQD